MESDENSKTRRGMFMPYFIDECDLKLEEEAQTTKMNVVCVCPKCGKRHRVNSFWTGKGIPRKFCPACKNSFYQ